MNTLYHFFINLLFGYLFGVSYTDLVLISTGGVIIDIDHIIYYINKFKKLKGFVTWAKRESSKHNPHFFLFHNFELITLFLLVGSFIYTDLRYLAIGFALHFIVDIATYLYVYRSRQPWFRFVWLYKMA